MCMCIYIYVYIHIQFEEALPELKAMFTDEARTPVQISYLEPPMQYLFEGPSKNPNPPKSKSKHKRVAFFWWLNLVRLYSLYKILYPKRRIFSYSIMHTIVSPNKILLKRNYIGGLRRAPPNLRPKPCSILILSSYAETFVENCFEQKHYLLHKNSIIFHIHIHILYNHK